MNPEVEAYLAGGRIPWSKGYKPYRMDLLQRVVKDESLLAIFREGRQLPREYAFGLDERLVEYPWVLSRLSSGPGCFLDAGSTFNYPYLLELPQASGKKVVILTLAPERQFGIKNVTYVYDDLREIPYRDDWFEEIACISTLEHVGLDNTRIYTSDQTFREEKGGEFGKVLSELRRVLKPGGQLLLTVPFGKAQNFGWMQQFDRAGIERIIECFGAECVEKTFFRHGPGGWQVCSDTDCADLEYFDVHSATEPAPDRAAAARAVACLRFRKLVPAAWKPVQSVMKPCEVSIVLGTYNRLPFLKAAVASIREDAAKLAHEIIVIDGGSTDGTTEWLVQQKDVVAIIQHNRGEFRGRPIERKSWGYFMNLGFKAARAEAVAMISDDCILLPGALAGGLARLRAARQEGRTVGGVAFYFRNWPAEPNYYVQYTLGGKLFVNHGLYSREALRAIGYADEDTYQFYKADGDLCLRMWQAGYEVVDSPESFVEHHHSAEEAVRQSNNAALQHDRVAYVERWKGIFYFPDRPEQRKRLEISRADPEKRAERVFGAINQQFLRIPKSDEEWTKWIRASRPNLPDWESVLGKNADLWQEARRRAKGGPKVLIGTSVPGFAAHSMIESIIAVALTLRGADVTFLTCDQALPACMRAERTEVPHAATLVDGHFNQHRVCLECPQTGRLLYDPLALRRVEFGQYITLQDREEIARIARSLPFAELGGFRWRGMPVGEHALAGVLRYFASGNLDREPEAEAVARRYLEGTMRSAAAVQRLLVAEKFDSAFLNHGIYSPQGMVAEACRAAGISPKIWHIAYRKSCFMFSHDDTYHRTMLTEPVETWKNIEWTPRLEQEVMEYLRSRWKGTNDWIWFHEKPEESIDKICAEIGVDLRKPTVGLLTNVMWDAQLHYGTNAFPNMLEWVLASIEHFSRRPDLQLLIRVHPAEVRGTMKSRQPIVDEIKARWPQLPSNVFIIPPESQVSTYAAMMQCDSVIIYATKTGVELSAMGIPVVVAGEAWIRNKGFSLDASSPEEYEQILLSLPLRRRLSERELLLAKKYAYHFFFRRMVPLSFMQPASDWPPYRLAVADLAALGPGRDAGLDLACDGILRGTPFVYPAEKLMHG